MEEGLAEYEDLLLLLKEIPLVKIRVWTLLVRRPFFPVDGKPICVVFAGADDTPMPDSRVAQKSSAC